MNDCRAIHETTLKTLIDIWDGIKSLSKDIGNSDYDFEKLISLRKKTRPGAYSSMARAASNLTLVFPVICSKNISIENASMISKAIEKNAVSMMQKVFSSWQLAGSDIGSVQDYINQFHNNINSRAASLDDVFRLTTKLVESGSVDERALNAAQPLLRQDIRNLDFYLPTDINESSINRFAVKEGATVVELEPLEKRGSKPKQVGSGFKFVNSDDSIEADSPGAAAARRMKDSNDVMKGYADFFSKQVLDTDYKKANELMPTSMVVNFKVKDDKSDNVIDFDSAVIGIKAKLYPISSDDIVNHVGDKVQSKRNWLVDFFRASTRETSFMKDFVLAIDKAKIDAMSLSDRKSSSDKMWKVLERRALSRKLNKTDNSAAAITTLVLSQEEVEYMRKNNNIDVERIPNVIGLFESLNLMCIVIVDETLEVAKFIYDDNDPMWETISFTHLEREASDNSYKKVVNLMTKISR